MVHCLFNANLLTGRLHPGKTKIFPCGIALLPRPTVSSKRISTSFRVRRCFWRHNALFYRTRKRLALTDFRAGLTPASSRDGRCLCLKVLLTTPSFRKTFFASLTSAPSNKHPIPAQGLFPVWQCELVNHSLEIGNRLT